MHNIPPSIYEDDIINLMQQIKKFSRLIENPAIVFIVISLLFGTLSAIYVPQLSVNDEQMHLLRSYTLSDAEVKSTDCSYPKEIIEHAKGSPAGNYDSNFSTSLDIDNKEVYTCGSAASYSPITHIPQAVGIVIAKLFGVSSGALVLMGRLANLLFYIASLYFIIRYVRVGKWTFTVVALLPLMIHTAASLSGDVMNNVVIMAFVALTLNLFTKKSLIAKKEVVMLLVLGALLSLTKSVNLLLLLPLVFLPKTLFKPNVKLKRIPFNINKWGIGLLLLFVSLAALLVWQSLYNAPLLVSNHPIDPVGLKRALNILYNTFVNPAIGYTDFIFKGIAGSFSSYKYNLPLFVLFVSLSLFVFSLLVRSSDDKYTITKNIKVLAIINSAVIVLFVLAVTYAMFTAWATLPVIGGPGVMHAEGVQGRYFTPLLVLLIPAGLAIRRHISISTSSAKITGLIVATVSTAVLAFYTLQTLLTF